NYEVKHKYDCRDNLTDWTTEKEIKNILTKTFEVPEGKKSNKIKINKEIQYAPLESIKGFINIYYTCEGDLCINERKQEGWSNSRILNVNTAYKELAMGMSLLLRKFSILPRLQTIERKTKNHSTMYRLVLGGASYNKYMDTLSIYNRYKDLTERNVGANNGVYVGGYLLSPIHDITYTDEVKKVYDFTTTTHVFEANGALTHNCHHSKADTWFNNLSLCENADYRIGLTGTVDKKDEMGYQRLQALFTRVIAKVTNEQMIDQGVSSKPIIRVVPMVEPRDIEQVDNYLEAYRLGIVENDARNETIAKLAVGYKLRKPGGVLISVKEIDHGDRILEKLQDMNADVGFRHGNSDIEHRTNTLHKFAQGELDILIASTIIDEGVDMKSIGCMVLAAGGKSMRQQLQRIGRGLRLNGIDGNRVMVFDFEDK